MRMHLLASLEVPSEVELLGTLFFLQLPGGQPRADREANYGGEIDPPLPTSAPHWGSGVQWGESSE